MHGFGKSARAPILQADSERVVAAAAIGGRRLASGGYAPRHVIPALAGAIRSRFGSSLATGVLHWAPAALTLLVLTLAPAAAWAQSTGCTEVNAGDLNLTATFDSSGIVTATNGGGLGGTSTAISVGSNTTNTFALNDIVTFTITLIPGIEGYGLNKDLTYYPSSTNAVSGNYSTGPLGSGQLKKISANLAWSGSATAGGNVSITATCTPAGAPTPTVTSISPTSGPTAGNTTVTISGSGFSATAASNTVKFGTTAATVTAASTTQLTATSPSGSGVVEISPCRRTS